MIRLYPKGTTDFSENGIELHPREADVNWQIAGRFDCTMIIPREAAEGIEFDYGQILRVSVPEEHVGSINLGTVSYYETTADTPLYSQIPKAISISYNNWEALRSYMAGDKVTYDKKNWRCVTGHGGLSVPPPNGGLWTQIPSSTMDGGKTIMTLASGTTVMKVQDFNSTYMEVATLTGYQGYVRIADCQATGDTEERTVPAFDISDQLFTIITIDKETDEHSITIEAEHISYQLGRTVLGECNVVGVNPATALMFIAGAMQESYSGGLFTGIDDGEITSDWSWTNAQSAILDPQKGLLKSISARVIRNNLDIYIVPNPEGDATYQVTYGVNLERVHWNGDVSGIVTRIYPIAQREDGTRITLPEKYVDSVLPVPYIRPEVLDTKLKIGQKIENSDGSEVELTEDDVYTRMREAAQNRFSVDHCDQAEVTLELDWVHMPDTVEYAPYLSLRNAAPADWVRVDDAPMGVDTVIQLTEYDFDPILCRYKKTQFGDKKQKATVAGYNIKSGAVSGRTLAPNSVDGSVLAARSITAREIEAGSITAEEIASKIITTELLAANAVTADEIAANSVTTEKLLAGSVTADKIGANAITTEKLMAGAVTAAKIGAYAVTAEKIDAGAVTADKLAAGSVTASKIDTTDLTAIHAALQTVEIIDAQIESADINYLQVKDLNAQSAYFGQAVIQEGLANKLFIPRLSVVYAQMVQATISDLVIQATNDNFYKLDVDLAGNVTATQVTPSAAEIAQGHTNDGRTIYLGTDIVAEDLNTTNIYASHALMDELNANIINVDQLFAREATIQQINAMDLSSNTYIRSTIGNWLSGSTITQTINSLDSRISSLGYGTVYFQPNEPSHSELVPGDIWIQSTPAGTWANVLNDYATWNAINSSVGTWQTLGGIPKMYTWDGRFWQEMYDALLPTIVQTEIQQLSDQIALRATTAEVDALGNLVDEFSAELTIQAQEIEAAVSAVNAKASTYVMPVDPRSAHTVTIGDIWILSDDVATWDDVKTKYSTWNVVKSTYNQWLRLIGSATYVWNGSEWIETSDRATEIYQRTLINQNAVSISLIAETTAILEGEVYNLNSQFVVTNSAISAEVTRATTAEGNKIDKTSQYQTADSIVTAANSWITGKLQDSSWIEQTATGINAFVSSNYYGIQSGISIAASGIEISGAKYVKIKSGGKFLVDSGNFEIDTSGNVTVKGILQAAANSVIGGWTLGSTNLHAGTGANYVALASSGVYAMWAGAESAANAPWRVKRDGAMTVTKLMILNESGTETEVNLRTYGLWKLNYHTVKSYGTNSITLSNGATVNFNTAASVTLTGTWSGSTFTVTNSGNAQTSAASVEFVNALSSIAAYLFTAENHTATMAVKDSNRGNTVLTETYDATALYNAVRNAAKEEGIEEYYNSSYWEKATAENNWTPKIPNSTNTGSEDWTDSGASDAYAAASPSSGTASGRSGSSYAWTFRILKEDGSGKNLTIDCSLIYSDARQGYTQGIFSQYSGEQLYTIGQSGPQRYTGTLYVKS